MVKLLLKGDTMSKRVLITGAKWFLEPGEQTR